VVCLAGVLAAVACLGAGCAPKAPAPADTAAKPRVEKSGSGVVSVTFTIDPPVVRLDRDTLLTIRITAPARVRVKLPMVDSRVKGFLVAGTYDSQPEAKDGQIRQERHIRLTPQIAPEYRLAPMAITYKDGTQEQWFPTRPVVLSSEPLVKGQPGSDIAGARGCIWVYPGFKTVVGYLFAATGVAALLWGAWFVSKRIHRAVKLRRMSPRERALHELAELLNRNLLEKDRVKDFYFDLTMIVRAYIERAHAIRAPEQTTEEFLVAVSQDSRFPHEVVARLRAFLQAADMVKYAAYRPERPAVDQAVTTARNYIETDSLSSPTHTPTPGTEHQTPNPEP
jgi:hypothetical protein